MSILSTNLMQMYWQQGNASRLPDGYREVAYIESDGNQWIDTGVAMSSNLTMTMQMQYTVIGSAQQSGVGLNGNPWMRFTMGTTRENSTSPYNFVCCLGANIVITTVPMDTNLHTLTLNASTGVFQVDLQSFYTTPAIFSSSNTVYLMAVNMDYLGVYNSCKAKFYSAKLDIYATALRDFIPCVRIADTKPGLYDNCGSICTLTNSPFYVNSGTGTDFTWAEL